VAVGAGVAEGDITGAGVASALGTGVAGGGVVTVLAVGAVVGITVAMGLAVGEAATPRDGAIAAGVGDGVLITGAGAATVKAADARTTPATKPSAAFFACPRVVTAEIICDPAADCGTVTLTLNLPCPPVFTTGIPVDAPSNSS
jgi:hypothetical protein